MAGPGGPRWPRGCRQSPAPLRAWRAGALRAGPPPPWGQQPGTRLRVGWPASRGLGVPGAQRGQPWALWRGRAGRLLVPEEVQLLLALGEQALEAEVLPDDRQQLLQQVPLAQTLRAQERWLRGPLAGSGGRLNSEAPRGRRGSPRRVLLICAPCGRWLGHRWSLHSLVSGQKSLAFRGGTATGCGAACRGGALQGPKVKPGQRRGLGLSSWGLCL